MSLQNFTDISRLDSDVNAGFQFEFACRHCQRTWRSPFQPYRRGQFAGLLSAIAPYFRMNHHLSHGAVGLSHKGMRAARDSALAKAVELAERMYTACPQCNKEVCGDCFDGGRQLCSGCIEEARRKVRAEQAYHGGPAPAPAAASTPAPTGAALRCPNCQTAASGGRFCAECGYDMASTYKSCPGCGAMQMRQARFCTDCGHGF